MELGNRIKQLRNDINMSQDELAEKVYVSRQTISNWENDKSYPDVNSLVLLSTIFDTSIDNLIKGDIEVMKEKIEMQDVKDFNRLSWLYTVLLIVAIVSFLPLVKFMKITGVVIWVLVYGCALFFAFKIEKYKKKYDVQSYKEIVAFSQGRALDEINSVREKAKRPYQKAIIVTGMVVLGFVLGFIEYFLWV